MRAVKPEEIFKNEDADYKYLKLPEQVPLAVGNSICIDYKDGNKQEVEKDDGDVYRSSQGCFKIDHVELDNLSNGPGSSRIFSLPGWALQAIHQYAISSP